MVHNKKIIFLIMSTAMIACSFSLSHAYDGSVHSAINEKASEQTQILKEVLQQQLGLEPDPDEPDILDKFIGPRTIKEWIAYGGEAEDFGHPDIPWKWDPTSTRAFNHFHDPLKDWDEAHFDHWTNVFYLKYYYRSPVSTILWGLNPEEQDFYFNATGDWSWGKAREYYYDALTKETEGDRNQAFANCFRAVGQVMHLLQDMSVPLHTRNDVHVFPQNWLPEIGFNARWNYETYTKRNEMAFNEVLNNKRGNRLSNQMKLFLILLIPIDQVVSGDVHEKMT